MTAPQWFVDFWDHAPTIGEIILASVACAIIGIIVISLLAVWFNR